MENKETLSESNSTSMKSQPKILTGTDDFKKLLLNSDIFVDKSLLIKEIIEDSGDVVLITRPRRWGKSLNMDMIEKFLNIEVDSQGNPLLIEQKTNNKLFNGGAIDLGLSTGRTKILKKLNIAEYSSIMDEYQGQFPVISISFKEVKGTSYQEIEDKVRLNVKSLYDNYDYLLHSTKISDEEKQDFQNYLQGDVNLAYLQNNLLFLSKLVFKHFDQKTYILIDEYDTPINNAYIEFNHRTDEFKKVLNLFRGIFGASLKSNPYLEKGLITGICRIAKANLFSDLNNVREYTLLDKKFAKFYGFTQEEVDELLTKIPTITAPKKIKDWYNGYTFGGEIIYNPWSIMLCLSSEGKLDHYWLDSGGTGLIDKSLLSDDIQEELQELLEGKGIIKKLYKQISLLEIEDNPDIFYSLLVFAGYLNPSLTNDDEEYPRYKLTIPNREIRNIYVERVIKWVTNKLNIKVSDYDNFIELLTSQQIEKFGQKFSEYLMNSTSYHDLSKERDYHNLMGGLLAPLSREYIIESNRESGYGRFDHMLIPRANKGDSAIIIEYKLSETSEDLVPTAKIGLNQITNNRYDVKIKEYQYVKKIIKIVMAFCGKKVDLRYQVDELR